MKCKYCGANLEIDTPFCPYCGKENPIAKQHREDMAKFERDYKETKKEVLTNSKKFNLRTLRITVVAVTVAAFAILILLLVFNDELSYSHYRNKAEKYSINYLDEIKTLVDGRDYLTLARLINSKNIRVSYINKTELEDYRYVMNAARDYEQLFSSVMRVAGGGNSASGMPGTIAGEIRYIFKDIKQGRDEDEAGRFSDYYSDVERDTILLMETCFGMDKETAESLPGLSDAKLNLAIEEALYAFEE